MLEGINYLHANFQINILKKQRSYKTFRTLETLAEKKKKKLDPNIKRVVTKLMSCGTPFSPKLLFII